MTNDPDIRFASSIVDYVFRRLALDHLPAEKREALGIRSIEERKVGGRAEKIGELEAGTARAGEPADPRAAADRDHARSRRRRSWTRRSATSAARRCSRPARATSAGRAAAPAVARRLPPSNDRHRPGRPGPLRSGEGGAMVDNSRSCWGCITYSWRCRRARRRRRSGSTAPSSGSTQVDKPPELAPRGGVWFRDGDLEVHLGVEEPSSCRRARPTPRSSCENLETLRERIETAGLPGDRDDVPLEGFHAVSRARSVRQPDRAGRAGLAVTGAAVPAAPARGAAAVGAASRRRRPRPALGRRVVVEPGERVMIPTGVAVAIPDGHAGLVLPRSGLASKHGLTMANAPGLIDAGYRGEVICAAVNLDREEPVEIAWVIGSRSWSSSRSRRWSPPGRGAPRYRPRTGGFGSTGTS